MSKRVPIIIIVIVLAAFLVYIGVSAVNGTYGRAAQIAGADVTASREGNALVTKIRTVPGVASASFGFTSELVADRKSQITVLMRGGALEAQLQRIAGLARADYDHGEGDRAGAVLEITTPGAPTLTITDLSVSATQLTADLSAWTELRKSIGSSISLRLASSNARTLVFAAKKGPTFAWVSRHYVLLKSLAAAGFNWSLPFGSSNPGICEDAALPDVSVLSVLTELSSIVPIESCDSSQDQSGVEVYPSAPGGTPPAVLLGFVKGKTGVPFSTHAAQFAAVATVLLRSDAPNMNVGFFGADHEKPTVLRFFTGSCANGMVTNHDKTDAKSLSILRAHGVDILKHATLGQCSPKPAAPSSSPTPAG